MGGLLASFITYVECLSWTQATGKEALQSFHKFYLQKTEFNQSRNLKTFLSLSFTEYKNERTSYCIHYEQCNKIAATATSYCRREIMGSMQSIIPRKLSRFFNENYKWVINQRVAHTIGIQHTAEKKPLCGVGLLQATKRINYRIIVLLWMKRICLWVFHSCTTHWSLQPLACPCKGWWLCRHLRFL